MYNIVDNLQGKRPVFLKPQKRRAKTKLVKRCLWRCGQALLALFRRLRATVLILLLTLGLPGFYLTLHFLLRPSLDTLAADLQPAFCTVAVSTVLRGKNNCKWSSCRQGCTVQELYNCWQVLILKVNTTYDVNQTFSGYVTEETVKVTSIESGEQSETFTEMKMNNAVVSEEALNESVTNIDTDTVKDELIVGEEVGDKVLPMDVAPETTNVDLARLARLKINAEGCGYGPCEVWWTKFGRVGTTFTCYVSADGHLAVPDMDRNYVMLQALLGALPLLLSVASFLLMYRLYWRKGSTDRTLRLSPDPTVRKAKWEEARAEMFVQRAMDQKNKRTPKFDAALVMTVRNLRKNEIAAAESQQAWAGEEGMDSSQRKEKKKKLDLARRWRQIAAMAKLHPAISRKRRFPEVTLEL